MPDIIPVWALAVSGFALGESATSMHNNSTTAGVGGLMCVREHDAQSMFAMFKSRVMGEHFLSYHTALARTAVPIKRST